MTPEQITSFAAANAYLRRFHDQAHTAYTLDNMRRLMAHLGQPQDSFRAVHVAGTSGKTSTAYYLAALLTAAGCKTGLTVSPHVDELNERVQLNGRPLDEPAFCAALSEFLRLIADAPVRPSWFEVMVAFAFWYFAGEQVDYAVTEVGLGGLKDGTNVMSRPDKVCVITDIGFDHVNVLGTTLAAIAAQKAGIIQPGNHVFTYRQGAEIMQVLNEQAAARQGTLEVVSEQPNSDSSLPDYQFRNWELAYTAYKFIAERVKLPDLTRQVLAETRRTAVPGRMDIRQVAGKIVIMDGAHNAQKMTAFVESFRKLYPGVRPVVLLALREGKEYEAVAEVLAPLAARVIATTFATTQDLPIRSMPAAALAEAFAGRVPAVQAVPDHAAAWRALLASPEAVCIVTGSLYLLGQIRHNEQ